MSDKTIKTKIRFDGSLLKNKSIDIDVLSQSLLSLSNLIQESNNLINGDKAKLTIKVNANIEQNCFELLLSFGITFYEQIKTLIKNEDVATLKQLLEWIGLLLITVPAASIGFFKLVSKLKGNKLKKEDIIKQDENYVYIKIDGKEAKVNKETYKLYNSPSMLNYAKGFLKPLQNKGIDKIEFENNNNVEKFIKDDYDEFLNSKIEGDVEFLNKNITTRHLVLLSPVFDENVNQWSFKLDSNKIKVDISKTNIAKETLERGEVRVNDVYKVKLEEEEYKTVTGAYKIKYTILEVLEFKRGDYQQNLFQK